MCFRCRRGDGDHICALSGWEREKELLPDSDAMTESLGLHWYGRVELRSDMAGLSSGGIIGSPGGGEDDSAHELLEEGGWTEGYCI